MSHVKRELGSIEEQIHLLEVHSEDPDVIQEQLEICIVSYFIVFSFDFAIFTSYGSEILLKIII